MKVIQVTTRFGGLLVGWLIAQSLTDHSGPIQLPYIDPNLLIGAIGMLVLLGIADLRGLFDTVRVPADHPEESPPPREQVDMVRQQTTGGLPTSIKLFGAMGLVNFGMAGGYLAGALGVWHVGPMMGSPETTGAVVPVWVVLWGPIALLMAVLAFGISYYASTKPRALEAEDIGGDFDD